MLSLITLQTNLWKLVIFLIFYWYESLLIEPQHDKTNKVTVHPAKTQISLGIFAVRLMGS